MPDIPRRLNEETLVYHILNSSCCPTFFPSVFLRKTENRLVLGTSGNSVCFESSIMKHMLSNFKLSMFNMKTIRCLIFVAVTNLFDNLKKVDRIRSFPAFPSDFWCFVPGGIPWERFCLTWHRKVTRLLKLAVYSFLNFLSPFFLDFLGCALSWHQGLQITCLLYTFNQSSPFLR